MRQSQPRDQLINAQDEQQIAVVVGVARGVFGDALIAAYLHGSAVLGGLHPTSDVDVLAVINRHSAVDERRELIQQLMPISGSPVAGTARRPVELTVVSRSEVRPWRYPPRMEFQYGEWLKDDYKRGFVPDPAPNPDLAPLIKIALMGNHALVGPSPAEVLAPVPASDLRDAMLAGLDELMADLKRDTRNVLLTLARIWHTTATGEVTSKDAAAEWAAQRLRDPESGVIRRAGDQYLQGTHGEESWPEMMDDARATARAMVTRIRIG